MVNAVGLALRRPVNGVPIAAADAPVSALQGVLKNAAPERALVWKTENAGSFTM